jgi:hypothetical protein
MTSPPPPIKREKTEREIMAEALFLYKIAFDKQARATGGRVVWIGQHAFLWSVIEDKNFDEKWWAGLCSGMAIEWLKMRATGGDFAANLLAMRTEAFAITAANRDTIVEFATTLLESHRQQREVDEALALARLVPCGKKNFPYPFAKMEGAFARDRYFYISSAVHSMSAVSDAAGKMDFYDPNVGEVLSTSARMAGPYLKECIDASWKVKGDPEATKKQRSMTVELFTKG